jgi:hypothetical protein
MAQATDMNRKFRADQRYGLDGFDVYCQRIDASGNALGINQKIIMAKDHITFTYKLRFHCVLVLNNAIE